MKSLILAPPKVILRESPEDWHKATNGNACLITDTENPDPDLGDLSDYESAFLQIIRIDNYKTNDLLLIRAYELALAQNIQYICPLSEGDVMPAGFLRKHLRLEGALPEKLNYFRNKHLMKTRCRENGINTGDFLLTSSALDLYRFAEKFDFKVVTKPLDESGSKGVKIFNNKSDFEATLAKGLIHFYGSQVLVERFIHGDQYRVDGIYHNGQKYFLGVAQYINTHLDYLSGGYLGSVTLTSNDPLGQRMEAFARKVLEDALPNLGTFCFHLELYLEDDQIILGEVGCRLGGGSITEELELAFGINLKLTYVSLMVGNETNNFDNRDGHTETNAGQLHVAPNKGTLIAIPEFDQFNLKDVTEFRFRGKKNLSYEQMKKTNDELAYFVFKTPSVLDGVKKIESIVKDLDNAVKWEYKDEGK